jgi:hypothetical protein
VSPRSPLQAGRVTALHGLHPNPARYLPALAAALAIAAAAPAAPAMPRAWPAGDPDDAPARPGLAVRDRAPHELWAAAPARAPLWIALDVSMKQLEAGVASSSGIASSLRAAPSFGAMVLLGLPLDRLARPRLGPAPALAEGPPSAVPARPPPSPDPPALKPAPRASRAEVSPPTRAAPAPAVEPPRPLRVPVVVTPEAARAAVAAALRRARLADTDARVDALAARARAAAALPELRLRASRTVDEGQSFMPTEYDPMRTTATAGSSLWLEARATWKLDRLVFADEEVALERMRHDRAAAREKLAARVLALLFTWQRSLALADNPAASPEEQLTATLKALEAEADLDLATDGWFARWRATQPVPRLPGIAPAPAEGAPGRP